MLKRIAKHHKLLLIFAFVFLGLHSISFCFMSNQNAKEKIAFLIISWILFLIAFGGMTLLYAMQAKNQLMSKLWEAILILFIILPVIFSLYNLFLLIKAFATGYFMGVYPLNGVFVSTVCFCRKHITDK